MSDILEREMREDRLLRDAARAIVQADVAQLKASLAERSIPERIGDKIGEGATDVLDEAVAVADENKGVVATLIAAIILWFARHPLIDLVRGEDERDAERDAAEDR
jgi:hypothetical protein